MRNISVITRKRLLLFIVIVLGIVGGFQIWRYLHTGHIEITSADQSDTITLATENGEVIRTGQGEVSASIWAGHYTVTVGGKYFVARKIIEVRGRNTQTVRLSQPNIHNLKPVTSVYADGLISGNNQLRYLNSASQYLEQIDANNSFSFITLNKRFSSIRWASPNYGIGLADDGNLYTVIGSGLLRISLPNGSNAQTSQIAYDVSPKKELYVGIDRSLYLLAPNKKPKLIYTTKNNIDTVVAGANTVLVAYLESSGSVEDTTPVHLVSLSSNGKKLGTMDTTYTEGSQVGLAAKWAPDSTMIVVSDNEASAIYTPNLKKKAALPDARAHQFSWLDNSRFAYATEGYIWLYDLSSGEGRTIAVTDPETATIGLSFDKANNYLYVATSSASNPLIQRVSLTKDSSDSITEQLSTIFPSEIVNQTCSANFINITRPTILLSLDSRNSEIACRKALADKLTLLGLPSNLPVSLDIAQTDN